MELQVMYTCRSVHVDSESKRFSKIHTCMYITYITDKFGPERGTRGAQVPVVLSAIEYLDSESPKINRIPSSIFNLKVPVDKETQE